MQVLIELLKLTNNAQKIDLWAKLELCGRSPACLIASVLSVSARRKVVAMRTVRTDACSTSVMIRIAALAANTAPTALLQLFKSDAKLAESTESASKSSRLLIEDMVFEAIAALNPTRSSLSIQARSSLKTSVTVV